MYERRKTPLESDDIEVQSCSIDLRLEILSQVPFFSSLSGQEIAEVNRSFKEAGYQPGEVIYYSGDPARRLYVLASGKVKLLRHSLSGKDVLLDMLRPGEFFGSLSTLPGEEYADTASSQTMTCVLGISTEDFRGVLDVYPPVALRVLDITARRLKEAHERIRQLSAYSAERRIASTLLMLAAKFGQKRQGTGLLIQVPLSRDDLAEMTGTTPETASRVMSHLQKEGLIESGRQWVAIRDRRRLQDILEETTE